jgi:folate/biopterin transporter
LSFKVGGLIAAAVEGTVADSINPRVVIWIATPLCLAIFVPTLLGWLPETRLGSAVPLASTPPGPIGNTDGVSALKARFRFRVSAAAEGHKGTIALGVLTSAVAVILAVLTLLAARTVILVGLIIMSIIALGTGFLVLPIVIAKANLFMFLRELVYLQIDGILDYYYTADEVCLPDGPHFSYSYYQSLANIITNVAGLLGTVLFQRFFLRGTFRQIFWITTFMKIAASLIDIVIVKRWNESVGIPDKATYLFGDAIVYQLTSQLDFMPSVILVSRLCPRGMEATIYALIAGVSNLGQVSSRTLGYMVSEWLEIRTVVPCDFTNLPALITIGHVLTPLLVLPLSVLLLPPTKMTEAMANLDSRAAPGPHPDSEEAKAARRATDGNLEMRRSQAARASQYAVFAGREEDATGDKPRTHFSPAVVPPWEATDDREPLAGVPPATEVATTNGARGSRARRAAADPDDAAVAAM